MDEIELEYNKISASFEAATPSLSSKFHRATRGHVLDGDLLYRLLVDLWGSKTLQSLPEHPRLVLVGTQADIPLPQPYLIRSRKLDSDAEKRIAFDYTYEGTLADALRCATAAPTFYGPHKIQGRVVVDGAVHNNK